MEGENAKGEPIRNLHAEWMQKRRQSLIRRAADDMLTETIRNAVGQRVARLRLAADNLDQQRVMIEQQFQKMSGV